MRIDVLTISETNLIDNADYEQIHISGYKLYRKDRLSGDEGVACYVSKSLPYNRISDLEIEENIWVQVNLPKTKPLVIRAVYRSPSSKVDYIDRMETSIATALAQGKETLVLVDMNIDLLPV